MSADPPGTDDVSIGTASRSTAAPVDPVPDAARVARERVRPLPYLMLAPATVLLVVVLGYPIVRMISLSLQRAKLRDLNRGTTAWNAGKNYRTILTDPYLWTVTLRTVVFAAVCVITTLVAGLAIALLLQRLGRAMRLVLSVGLLMAWATPALTATQVWQWLFDTQFGVVNWALTSLGLEGFRNYSWLASPVSLLAVAAVIVVWGAIPFVCLTLFAGLTQIPGEIFEAAELDGARGLKLLRQITLPLLAPIITILVALSTIWDFRVFTQVFILQKAGGITRDTDLLGIYAYRTSFAANDFGAGSAIGVLMVVLLLGFSVFYVRRMLEEVEA
ncbi:MAG: sugar ABC transporter permease [Kineosporiaceae bacterium]|nr:sugar ABC transporter permease [Kineosporiaceae bacterium]MBK7622073.1 sugar ABC transporter permease [Kineosporiaceae bacterium]MBK8074383.1 sugar ABC transporter permease [Kineosporiaceae bacterium]